jgi:hypothetical protein
VWNALETDCEPRRFIAIEARRADTAFAGGDSHRTPHHHLFLFVPPPPFAQRLGERARERGYPKLGRVIPPNYRSQTAIYRFDEIKAISDFR